METFLRNRLWAILKTPNMWGPPLGIELQILLLVEMWNVTQGKDRDFVDRTSERFTYFVFMRFKSPSATFPISLRLDLKDDSTEEFIMALRDFCTTEGFTELPMVDV